MSQMTREEAGSGRWRPAILFLLISLQPILGLGGDPSSSKGAKTESHSSSGLNALYVFLGVLAVIFLAVLLYRQWQKKKREEQHARLLRLFEEDDELELELGLRD